MSTRKRVALALSLVTAATAVSLTAISLASAGDEHSMTAVAAEATGRFHNLDAAKAAGYSVLVTDVNGLTCIADPHGAGGMGVHYANPAYLGDGGSIDATKPGALVYAPNADGQPKLAALEYILFGSEWTGGRNNPPTLFGQQFFYTPGQVPDGIPNRFGLPGFWSLHVWIWNPNPSGMFQPWNPGVKC